MLVPSNGINFMLTIKFLHKKLAEKEEMKKMETFNVSAAAQVKGRKPIKKKKNTLKVEGDHKTTQDTRKLYTWEWSDGEKGRKRNSAIFDETFFQSHISGLSCHSLDSVSDFYDQKFRLVCLLNVSESSRNRL